MEMVSPLTESDTLLVGAEGDPLPLLLPPTPPLLPAAAPVRLLGGVGSCRATRPLTGELDHCGCCWCNCGVGEELGRAVAAASAAAAAAAPCMSPLIRSELALARSGCPRAAAEARGRDGVLREGGTDTAAGDDAAGLGMVEGVLGPTDGEAADTGGTGGTKPARACTRAALAVVVRS